MAGDGAITKRVGALDGLRGVAIAQVMAVHFLRDRGQVALAIGVDVFFVLSGFLITRLLISQSTSDRGVEIKSFLRRRFARIYPALIALCLFFLVTGTWLFGTGPKLVVAQVVAALTFTFPLLAATRVDSGLALLPLWSLSVEAWFYLAWSPFLVWFLSRSSDRGLRRLVVALIGACVAVQLVRMLSYSGPSVVAHRLRVDLFAVGAVWAIAGHLWGPNLGRWVRWVAGLALPLLVLSSLLSRPFPYDFEAGVGVLPDAIARFFGPWGGPGFALCMWAIGALVLVAFRDGSFWAAIVLSWRPLVGLGTISYSVYLWHYPIAQLVYDHGPEFLRWDKDVVDIRQVVAYSLVCTVISIGVGYMSYRYIERGTVMRALKSRIAGRTDTVATTQEPRS